MTIPTTLLDELLKDYQKPEDLLGESGLLQQLTKALIERVLQGELTHQLGYEKYERGAKATPNARNGSSPKTLKSKHGTVEIAVPRDFLALVGDSLAFDFHWCDNPAELKDPVSLCTDGDSAPNRRFNYRCVWQK